MANEDVFIIPQIPELAEESVKGIIDELDWMKATSIKLLSKRSDISNYIDRCIEQGIVALDLESTGLSTRLDKEGNPVYRIVGVSIALNRNDGVYIAVEHKDTDKNVPLDFLLSEVKRLSANCVLIFHNFKYDGQMLRNYNILIGGKQCDPKAFEDTLIMAAVVDASRKNKGLKPLSKLLLNREMLNIKHLGVKVSSKDVPAFDYVPPEKAAYYAAPDAMNTFYLYEVFKAELNRQDPKGSEGPWTIYNKIEKPCLFVTMEMERNLVKLDVGYLNKIREELEKRSEECLKAVYRVANRPIDINSPKQLAVLLYEELKLPYMGQSETKSNVKETNEGVLEKIKDKHPVIMTILDYRHYEKQLNTYVYNFLKNVDEDGFIKFELNQNRADTGRYTASGGKGIHIDGYCKVQCQNIPRPVKEDEKTFDMRRALVARDGFKIVTIDYSGEELRISANFSHEPKWEKEFLEGTGDLHTMTGRIIHNKSQITKEERGLAKSMNFLIIYGGGAKRFAAQTGLSVERSKKMIQNFFNQYTVLKRWLEAEKKRSRRRKYSTTAIGRRRPLKEFYDSSDGYIRSKGDRCAINSKVQGTGADIIKIALARVSKYIRENGLSEKIRILMPIHDEIVYEIANDGTPEGKAFFGRAIEEISEIMKLNDITEKLGWSIPLEVDAEYGDTLSITNDYFKEKEALEKEDSNNNNGDGGTKKEEEEQIEEDINPGINLKKIEEIKEERLKEKKVNKNVDSDTMDLTVIEHNTGDQQGLSFYAEVKSKIFDNADKEKASEMLSDSKEIVANEIKEHLQLKDLIDPRGFFEWPVTNINTVVVSQFKIALKILKDLSGTFVGPKCRIKLVDAEGKVLYKSEQQVPVDAFLFAAIWFNL